MSGRFDSSRLEALSDGVIAIAITLLVLEISVPEEEFDHMLRAIADEWPSYLAYVTSFLTIGAAWFVHHGIFRQMSHADHTVVRLNLVFLMMISFQPFPTRLLAEAVRANEGEQVAAIFYGGVLVTILLILAAMARYVAGRPALLHEDADTAELLGLAGRLTPGFASYARVFALALVVPGVAAFGFLGVAAVAVNSIRSEEPA